MLGYIAALFVCAKGGHLVTVNPTADPINALKPTPRGGKRQAASSKQQAASADGDPRSTDPATRGRCLDVQPARSPDDRDVARRERQHHKGSSDGARCCAIGNGDRMGPPEWREKCCDLKRCGRRAADDKRLVLDLIAGKPMS